MKFPLDYMEWLIIGLMIGFCAVLALVANHFRIFDRGGCLAALALGLLVSLTGMYQWLSLLFILMVAVYASTRFRFREKESKGLQEGKSGCRGYKSILANGGVACAIAFSTLFFPHKVFMLAFPFLVAVASANSDVFASEIGGISNNAYLITNLEKVKPGTNGGVSWLGLGAAFAGSLLISAAGHLLFHLSLKLVLPAALLGFVGCQIDSLLGATIEGRRLTRKGLVLGKEGVNLTSIFLTSVLAFGLIA
jgi:uncharacterized protein (TIGR00297 family)